jgi:diguanylate cyclase (GGDEF)-like protein
VVPAVAGAALLAGVVRVLIDGHALFPGGTVGWSFAFLTGIIVGHLVAMGRDRWWGGTGSGAALTLAMLMLYGWVPAVLVSLAVVVLVGAARRHRWRQALLHGAIDILGIGAGALTLALCGTRPSVESPWLPAAWSATAAVTVCVTGLAYLAATRALLWWAFAPRAGGLPTVARTALVRQGMVGVALLGISPLILVVACDKPSLLPLFSVPLIALDSTLWIAHARAEEQLRDPLTGLPNRQWLLERAWSALDVAQERAQHPEEPGPAASPGGRVGLILIDLDKFRSVNDTLGHLAGDRLLLQIADRLRLALPRGAEAARLGGDEFAVLLPSCDSPTRAQRVARALVAALGSPIGLDGLTLVLEASAGVAVFPDHALDAEGLLRRADVAMYQAKRDRSGVEVYEVSRDGNTPDRLGLLGDLRRALEAGEVELHYQPKVRFDGQVAGLEALVRWEHPDRGRVSPEEFITMAETSGLMPQLTEYVLDTALAQIARWREAGLDVPVAVNVSPRDVHSPGFAGAVALPAAGDHRARAAGGPAAGRRDAQRPHRARREDVAGRLRHRLLLAGAPAPAAGQRTEDRPLVRGPAGGGPRGRRDRALHRGPGALAGPDGRRRGRGGRRDLGAAARPALRCRAGLAGRRRDAARGGHRLAACPGRRGLAAARRRRTRRRHPAGAHRGRRGRTRARRGRRGPAAVRPRRHLLTRAGRAGRTPPGRPGGNAVRAGTAGPVGLGPQSTSHPQRTAACLASRARRSPTSAGWHDWSSPAKSWTTSRSSSTTSSVP